MTEVRERCRLEHDSIDEKEIPIDAYYGMQTLRIHENLNITGLKVHPELIVSVAQIKKVVAITNFEVSEFSKERASAVVKACDETVDGRLHDQSTVDPIQGGAGTSLNMNVNKVIVNRAIEILGGTKGDCSIVNPNDHVNFGQSINGVLPPCGKMTVLILLRRVQVQLKRLGKALLEKFDEFGAVIRMGRTQLQDIAPIRSGQEFHVYASAIGRDICRFGGAEEEICPLNMGGTAIGTDLDADTTYPHRAIKNMSTITDEELVQSYNTIDMTQNLDDCTIVSGIAKGYIMNPSKTCNDLHLMSSSPCTGFCKIGLPAKQNSPSIMPGKINPVTSKVVSQVTFDAIGNDVTTTMVAEADQLELNTFKPIIFYSLFESIQTLNNAVQIPVDNCIVGIMTNEEHCREMVESSIGIITTICPYIGYETTTNIAKETLRTNQSVRELILRERLLSEEQLKTILSPYTMTKPGIQGRNPTDLPSD